MRHFLELFTCLYSSLVSLKHLRTEVLRRLRLPILEGFAPLILTPSASNPASSPRRITSFPLAHEPSSSKASLSTVPLTQIPPNRGQSVRMELVLLLGFGV